MGDRWIKEDRYEGLTISVVEGISENELIRLYGGDPNMSQPRLFDDAMGYLGVTGIDEDVFYVQTLTVGSQVVAIENNGWTGSVCEIARRATANGGRFMSVYWCDANVNDSLIYAENGVVTAYFAGRSCSGKYHVGPTMPDWFADHDTEQRDRQQWLTLITKATGVTVDQAWFTTPQRATQTPLVDDLLPQVVLGKNVSGGAIIQSNPHCWTP